MTNNKNKPVANKPENLKNENTQKALVPVKEYPSGDDVVIYRGTRIDDSPSVLAIVVGLIAIVLAITLTIFALNAIADRPMEQIGSISGNALPRVGKNETYTLMLDDTVKFSEGTDIVWYLNDTEVQRTTYHKGDTLSYQFAPTTAGENNLKINIGRRYTQNFAVNASKSLLSFQIPDIELTYGDQLPDMQYEIVGLMEGDTVENLNFDGAVCVDCKNNDRLDVGIYTLKLDKKLESDLYETQYGTGTLIVKPREVSASGSFSKTYDGSTTLNFHKVGLKGVLEGDDVSLSSDTLYFDSKNVGKNKKVSMLNAKLTGEQACNYVLSANSVLNGEITPKKVTLADTAVHSKMYDGTTNATFSNLGTLKGVVEGDIVALGNIKASFESAEAGTNKKVLISDILLVGSDKDNYVYDTSMTIQADITTNYMDILFNRPQIVG